MWGMGDFSGVSLSKLPWLAGFVVAGLLCSLLLVGFSAGVFGWKPLVLALIAGVAGSVVEFAFSGSDLENDIRQLLLRVFELYPIERKEYEHCVRAYAFVPIDKRMVFDEPISQTSGLLLNGWERLDSAE